MRVLTLVLISVILFQSCTKDKDDSETVSTPSGKLLTSITSHDAHGKLTEEVILFQNAHGMPDSLHAFKVENSNKVLTSGYRFTFSPDGKSVKRVPLEWSEGAPILFSFDEQNRIVSINNQQLQFGLGHKNPLGRLSFDTQSHLRTVCSNSFNGSGNPCMSIPWSKFVCIDEVEYEERADAMNYHKLAVLMYDLPVSVLCRFQFEQTSFFNLPVRRYTRSTYDCKDTQLNGQDDVSFTYVYDVTKDGYITKVILNFTTEIRFHYQ